MEELWEGYHERRTRKWLMGKPDSDVLEELLGLKDGGISTKAALEARRYITVKKPFIEGFQDRTLLEVTAKDSPVLTGEIVGALLDGFAGRLALNEALTPSLLAEGIIVLDAKDPEFGSPPDVEECVSEFLQIWGDARRAEVGKELKKRHRNDLAERIGLAPKREDLRNVQGPERSSSDSATLSAVQLRFL